MSRRANCWENAATEGFFKALKVGRVHLARYATPVHAWRDIVKWIEGFYNPVGLHVWIGYRSRVDVVRSWCLLRLM